MLRIALNYNVASDLSNCQFDETDRLVGLPRSDPPYVSDALLEALQRAPQQCVTPYGDLDHFRQMLSIVEEFVKPNKSVAVVRPDNTIIVVRDGGSDGFATKLLGEAYVRPNDMEEESAFFDHTQFAAWASDSTWCGDKVENGRNYAAEYLIRNCAWTPLSGPVLFAHANHGDDDEDDDDDDDEVEDPPSKVPRGS